ncbi:uncharacterized protein LOC129321742 [Prosopis cineraria]|uniref:uncharacterized protein LOC129296546 n=1 Tax=Prosopis cineraria TaxID=364024 RepID=UPI00240F663C|nr:uncharacterized protein LOC129296546 [Prosopis cineraria]XP_054823611.1 uncharacterized protein LOC129321742 [Prosopis cineraria]
MSKSPAILLMACSLSPFCSLSQAFCRHNLFHYPKMRAQKLRDNGESGNIVDANMRVLRERMRHVKKKEMAMSTRGWNYKQSYDDHHNMHKREAVISEIAETMGLACGAIGLVFLSGSLCIFLVSFLISHHV